MHRHWVQHCWVDEFGTTKFDCVTHEELAPALRWGTGRGGKEGWVKDRDVRFRKSKHTLESWHPSPAPPSLLEGKRFRAEDLTNWLAVDRDGNAAYAINRLLGVPEEQRPLCYRRVRSDE
jgi:hypothetical protein